MFMVKVMLQSLLRGQGFKLWFLYEYDSAALEKVWGSLYLVKCLGHHTCPLS